MSFELPVRRGEQHPLAKLSNDQRRACRDEFRARARTITDIARSYGISRPTVRRIGTQPDGFLTDPS